MGVKPSKKLTWSSISGSCSRDHTTSCFSETDFFCKLPVSSYGFCVLVPLAFGLHVMWFQPMLTPTSGPNSTYISEQNIMQKIRKILIRLAQVPSTVDRVKINVRLMTYSPWKTQAREKLTSISSKGGKSMWSKFFEKKIPEISEQSLKFVQNFWSMCFPGGTVE